MGDAPRVFVSYSHDSPEHRERVLALANDLRAQNLNCTLDQYEQAFPEGLPRWMRDRILEADFVLVVCTETYFQRAMGLERPDQGKGVNFESSLITQELYDAGYLNQKIIPVYFGDQRQFVPLELMKFLSYRVDTEEGFEELVRRLTGQPAVVKPPLPGSTPILPPKPIRRGDRPHSVADSAPVEDARAAQSSRRLWIWAAALVALLIAATVAYRFWRPTPVDRRDRTLPSFILLAEADRSGPMPVRPQAVKAYRDGLRFLANFKLARAKESFENVLLVEPDFYLAHAALAEVYLRDGKNDPAADEATVAYRHRSVLPPLVRREVEARYWRMWGNWDEAIAAYRSLPMTLENRLAEVEVETARGKPGDAENAKKTIKDLRRTCPQEPWVDQAEAQAANYAGDFRLQETAAARAAERAEKLGLYPLAARARLLHGIALEQLGDPTAALDELARARRAALEAVDSFELLRVLQVSGELKQRFGKLKAAAADYQEALITYQASGDVQGEVLQRNDLGTVIAYQGNLSMARACFEKAAEMAHQNSFREEEARALSNIGLVLRMQGKLGPAEKCFAAALHLAEGLGNESLIAQVHFLSANAKAARGDVQRAIQEHKLALERRDQEPSAATESWLALARVLLESGQPEQARDFAEKAQGEFHAEKLPQREAEAWVVLALISIRRGEASEARQAVDKASSCSENTEEVELRIKLIVAEAQVLAAEGKASEAVKRLQPLLSETEKKGLVEIGYEVRLVLGQLELTKDGDQARGRTLLTALAKEAGAAGFARVADEASKLLQKAG